MPIKARSKMISFRLSAEEYDHFRELCFSQGIRSVSELARAAVNRLICDPDPVHAAGEALETRLTNVEAQLQTLALELRRMKQPNGAVHNRDGLAAARGAS
jgi:hypothetical protein